MRVWLSLIMLAGCMPAENRNSDTSCGANQHHHSIGSNIDNHDFEQNARIVYPGSALTMDHNPGRLNVDVDETGTIKRLWCG